MKKLFPLLLCFALSISLVASAPISTPTKPSRVQGGHVITAQEWNDTIPGIYTYINTVAAVLNVLTTKGDLYIYNGVALTRLPAGTNGHAITADSTQATGVKYSSPTSQQPMTTKGDLLYQDDNTIKRLPVGTDGYALGVSAGLPAWTDLSGTTSFPRGTVVPYNFTYAGSSTVPAGWLVCDGTNSTPNLIGLFVIGTRPNGSGATAAAGGFGAKTPDAAGTGTATHTHSATYPSGNTDTNASNLEYSGGYRTPYGHAGTSATVGAPYHTHSVSGGSFTVTTNALEPSDYAMVYLIKQ